MWPTDMALGWCRVGGRAGVSEQWKCSVTVVPTPRERVQGHTLPTYRGLGNIDGTPLFLSFSLPVRKKRLEIPGLTSQLQWCPAGKGIWDHQEGEGPGPGVHNKGKPETHLFSHFCNSRSVRKPTPIEEISSQKKKMPTHERNTWSIRRESKWMSESANSEYRCLRSK